MAFALAKENRAFIERMIRMGKFNNQSEVVREALRRMEREENSYLNPPPLTETEARECFAPNPEEDRCERESIKQAASRLRRLGRKHASLDEL